MISRNKRRDGSLCEGNIIYTVGHDGGSFIDKFSRLNRASLIVPNRHVDSTLSQMTEYRDG